MDSENSGAQARIGLKTRLSWLLALVPPVFLLDLVTKRAVLHYMEPYGPTVGLIDNIARLRFIYNEGIVFGLNPSFFSGTVLAVFSVAVALLMTGYLLFARLDDIPTLAALCLVIGGACGNLVDRIAWGRVVDFIEIGIGDLTWPVFNVADISVTVGAVLLAWRLIFAAPAESGRSDGEKDS
ncbi:MAG: signal peptidase II [Candidatus Glassbacteria bacterium]|nr:signal peptidase II [Candidatus Glassbacteria bacterium]